MPNLQSVIGRILETRSNVPATRKALVAITGIDGSGKGYLTAKIASALRSQRVRVATINIDCWFNLPHIRFNKTNPAEHSTFMRSDLKISSLQLVIPLCNRGSLRIEMDYAKKRPRSTETSGTPADWVGFIRMLPRSDSLAVNETRIDQ